VTEVPEECRDRSPAELRRALQLHLQHIRSFGITRLPKSAVVEDRENDSVQSLVELRKNLGDCQRCKLSLCRKNIVFGSGDAQASIMFIGEGPGRDEDLQGLPFVGRAGELLTKMIIAMGLCREQVYIANVIKCRPPKNRDPEPDEIEACTPFLRDQIAAILPKVIIPMGNFAAKYMLGSTYGITRLRGHAYPCDTGVIVPTFHPAYLLRNPAAKREAWADLQLAMRHVIEP